MAAIEFENVSKQYRLGLVSTRTISHDLNRWWTTNILRKEDPYLTVGETNNRSQKAKSEYVWALKNINFKIEQGDVFGIIGKNGSGKSTLLKILSRVTSPTTGKIRAKGRIASLLEVGTGFHPEMTGRENIYMNGAILGMTKREIRNKLDEIVDFSGIEKYIDTPVKRYSSGMKVRLGFAIAAHLDPEILVVDEVLAVGDAEFQKKAIDKMQKIAIVEGRTVLFVSHNMNSVKKLCKTGLLLNNGKVDYIDEIENVVDKYIVKANSDNVYYPKNNIVQKVSAELKNEKIVISLEYKSDMVIKEPNLGFVIYDNYDNPLFGTNSVKAGVTNFGTISNEGKVTVSIDNPKLVDGTYPVSIWFNDTEAVRGKHLFKKEKCLTLYVEGMNHLFVKKNSAEGLIIPMCDWSFE